MSYIKAFLHNQKMKEIAKDTRMGEDVIEDHN